MLPSGKFSRFALAVAFALLALLVLVVARAGHHANGQLLSDLLQSAMVAWAAACSAWVTGRSSGYLRRLWLLFTVSLFLVVVAQVLETYYEGLAHTPFATPWPSDIFFILWVIPALVMLLPRPDKESAGIDWETILDFAQVGIVALTAFLYFFYLTSRWEAEGPQMVLKEIWLQMYRDLAIAAAFLMRSRGSVTEPPKALFRRVSLFFLLSTGASIAYLLSGLGGAGRAHWYDVAWCGPYLFVTAFASRWKTEDDAAMKEQTAPRRAAILSRMFPVCVPLLVLLMSRRIAYEQATLAWAAITASFFVSTTRLILTNEKQLHIADNLRKVEAALHQSSEMFTTAFRSSLDSISISSVPDGRFLVVNESLLHMTGYTQEEVLGKSSADLRLWVDEEHRERFLSKLYAGTEIRQEEFLMRTKAGETRTGQISAARVQLGDRLGVLAIVRDVTERRRAEEALRVSEERFRTLVQDLHIGIVLLGPNAETLFANRSVLKTFGVQNEEVAGKSSAQFEAATIREDGTEMPFAERPAPRAIATKQPVYGEVVGWRRDGSDEVLWTLVDAVPQITKQEEVTNVILSISDITQRKEAEEALHQLSARLLRLQDEERRRLGRELHDSLAQSVMAVNLDLARVTRSPVPLDKSARHALSEARKALREMSREIRTLSYLLHPPVLDELGLASAVKEYVHGFSERSGIALEIDIQPDFPRMPQEVETAFFRIVQESLANIQKHSGSSTGKILLWNGQGQVQLEIRDQGCGMAAKPGENGRGVPKPPRLGVGILGMRERMAQLGGTLEVQSNASGTAVHATIPLALEGSHGTPSHPRG